MYSITSGMSRGIVSQKPFSNKKRKQSIRKMLNRSGVSIPEFKISQKLKNILSRWLVFTLVIIWGIIILIKSLFFKPEHIISKIKFSDSTLATYQDIELFNLISDKVKGKNYYMLLSNNDKLLTDIQKKFPFVWKIDFQLEPIQEEISLEEKLITIWIQFPILTQLTWEQIGNQLAWIQATQTHFPLKLSKNNFKDWWTLWIQLMYYEPTVLVQLNDKKYAIWNESVYVEIKEWMLLWIRIPTEDDPNPEQLFTIESPQYLTWTNNLDWFFFEVSLSKMLQIASLAKEEFWNNMTRFVYLAGSTRFAIFTSDQKTLYFNFPEWTDIKAQREKQIFKYNTLRERYQSFGDVWTIDLWALEDNKVIIKY